MSDTIINKEEMKKAINEFGYSFKRTDKGVLFRFWTQFNTIIECSESQIKGLDENNLIVDDKTWIITADFADCLKEDFNISKLVQAIPIEKPIEKVIEKLIEKPLIKETKNLSKEEILNKISESIARHFSNDYILNTLASMKANGDEEDKRYKWFVKTCVSYGQGSNDLSFGCNPKGVQVSKPFEELLKWKDVYNRAKDLPFTTKEQRNRDKVVTIKVKYGLSTDWKTKEDVKAYWITDNRSQVGISSCLGGCHSSAGNIGGINKETGKVITFEDALKHQVDWIKKDVLEDGVKEENIKIIYEDMNEQDMLEHKNRKQEEAKRDLEYAQKEINSYSDKLKKAMETKEKCEQMLKTN